MLADFIFIGSEANFTCSFYNYKFSDCTQNVVYTLATKSFDDLEIVLPRPQSGLGANFSLGSSKYDFAFLIYRVILNDCSRSRPCPCYYVFAAFM
jgi:hypothetical protein